MRNQQILVCPTCKKQKCEGRRLTGKVKRIHPPHDIIDIEIRECQASYNNGKWEHHWIEAHGIDKWVEVNLVV